MFYKLSCHRVDAFNNQKIYEGFRISFFRIIALSFGYACKLSGGDNDEAFTPISTIGKSVYSMKG